MCNAQGVLCFRLGYGVPPADLISDFEQHRQFTRNHRIAMGVETTSKSSSGTSVSDLHGQVSRLVWPRSDNRGL